MSTGPRGWHDGADQEAHLRGLTSARAVRQLPGGSLWRWRHAIGAAVAVGLIIWSGDILGGRLAALAVPTVLLAMVALVPPVRRLTLGWAWGVLTPNRVRQACVQAGALSRSGRAPMPFFTRRTPCGEVVYLYCPRGLSPTQIAAAKPAIAAICWARRVEVLAMPRFPNLAVVAVERAVEGQSPSRSELALRRRVDRHTGRPSPTFGPIA